MKKFLTTGTVILTATAAALAVAPPPPDFSNWAPELNADHVFCGKKDGTVPVPSGVTPNYDVRKYVIAMTIDDGNQMVDATTTVRVKSKEANLTQISLDLTDDLTVTQVTRGATALTFTHENNLLMITLDRPMALNEIFEVTVAYNGTPGYGFFFTSKGVYTSTEMSYSRNWFPCYDVPADKAEDGCVLDLTVRDDWYVAANGLLQTAPARDAGTARFYWVENYAIAPYLIAFTAADYYTAFTQTWRGMPVDYFIWASQANDAPIYFEHQPDMLDCFSNKFCEYAFKAEKYGVAGVASFLWGGMENQTCTFIKDSYINPSHSGDHLLAHELAHDWWGDMVTCGTWADLWLNEGSATYCDALYTEYSDGDAAFRARMQYYAALYFQEDRQHRFPIYDPEDPWSATVYEKGAWVLHMLRRLLGDNNFYQAWNNYGAAHKYGTAVTDDLQAEFEAVYGSSLTWFFDQWVYKAGYPEFKYSWVTSNGGRTVTITIEQVQVVTPLTPLFRCLVDLTINCEGNVAHAESVWVNKRKHVFEFTYPEVVQSVDFDKDVWLLHKHEVNNAVTLDYFRARHGDGGVVLSWATGAEQDLAGFNLYRGENGAGAAANGKVKLNATLITGRSPYRFVDAGARADDSFSYWLEAVENSGRGETYGPANAPPASKPTAFALYGCRPNPSHGATTFAFSLATAGPAALTLYDLAGREVWRREGRYDAGENEVAAVLEVPAGVYIYRLEAAGNAAAKRMVVVK